MNNENELYEINTNNNEIKSGQQFDSREYDNIESSDISTAVDVNDPRNVKNDNEEFYYSTGSIENPTNKIGNLYVFLYKDGKPRIVIGPHCKYF